MIDKKAIKMLMLEKDIKGVVLAARLGVTPQNLVCFLNKKNYTQQDLERLAAALGVVYISEFRNK